MVLKSLVSSAFNHLTWLAAQESFIAFSHCEGFKSYKMAVVHHPSYYPDLSPWDFLFPKMKLKLLLNC
jgi:hypothetical protein